MGLCAISRWCEVQKQRRSAVKLGSRPNFRADHAPNPVPPGINPGPTSKNKHLPYISIGYGGESVSQSPLKYKAFSTFLDQNPPFELQPEMEFGLRQKPIPTDDPIIDNTPFRRLAKGNLPSHRSPWRVGVCPLKAKVTRFESCRAQPISLFCSPMRAPRLKL
jgi:hypothetical protein